ncbi:hypothetical protein L2E82_22209 [Cichorium intybus]|uniref:Uncharacterized protein n=1 Tax=Cichorium intybus TaxID=13427 RepID=A0ACB9DWU2_CICIN|nr:hypothetical protein L2E82_22209 [Cichorium intybus]
MTIMEIYGKTPSLVLNPSSSTLAIDGSRRKTITISEFSGELIFSYTSNPFSFSKPSLRQAPPKPVGPVSAQPHHATSKLTSAYVKYWGILIRNLEGALTNQHTVATEIISTVVGFLLTITNTVLTTLGAIEETSEVSQLLLHDFESLLMVNWESD